MYYDDENFHFLWYGGVLFSILFRQKGGLSYIFPSSLKRGRLSYISPEKFANVKKGVYPAQPTRTPF